MSRALAKFGLFPSEGLRSLAASVRIHRLGQARPSSWRGNGFPQVDPLMGGRYWPACTAWWNKRYGLVTADVSQPDGGENLDALA